VKEQSVEFPDGSFEVQMTVVMPTGKTDPELGSQVTFVPD
jgi:hypothetical protein